MKHYYYCRSLRVSFPLFGVLLALILVGWFVLVVHVSAQEKIQWSPQRTVPMYHPETEPPILIADQSGIVHAFSSQWLEEPDSSVRAIMYNQWTAESGWTAPVDILLSPIKNDARLLDVYLDKNGIFHLVFFGGDDIQSNIYYSSVPAARANFSPAWSKPTIIGQTGLTPENGIIGGDDNGNLMVVFSGNSFGRGLYTTTSSDSGDYWSEARLVFPAYEKDSTPYYLQKIVSSDGKLHLVWSVNNINNHGLAIYYANYDFGSKEWAKPLVIAEPQEAGTLGTQVPAIVEHNGVLHISYYNSESGMQYFVTSNDMGLTWSKPFNPFPHVGLSGPGYFVIDSNNDLHYFWAQRITLNQGEVHGMWHTVWQGSRWSQFEALVLGEKVKDTVGFSSFDPNTPHVAISRGNNVLVTWRTDRGSRGNGVWFSTAVLDAPRLPALPLPTLNPVPINNENDELSIEEKKESFPEVVPEFNMEQDVSVPNSANPIQEIPIALLPVSLLILIILFWQYYKARYR